MKQFVLYSLLLTLPAIVRAETPEELDSLAASAVSPDAATAAAAREQLRSRGPAGLQALLEAHAELLLMHRQGSLPDARTDEWKRLSSAVNEVGQQFDCHASGLFWHTDLEAAKAEAKASGKPILSLRMLGYLNEECSCANSRFFRSALYANENISNYLRENYVLHWKSVRPVPVVTIDFGDGRVLKRTLTGNSIHYVLDAQGRPVDGLPGLYGPQAFLAHLERLNKVAQYTAAMNEQERQEVLTFYHSTQARKLLDAWKADLEKVKAAMEPKPEGEQQANAAQAARLAVGKGRLEIPILAAIDLDKQMQPLEEATTEAIWQGIAQLHQEEANLDAGSIRLIREHNPSAVAASGTTRTKRLVEDPLLRLVRVFQNSIALDTVQNEYQRHLRIHEWFLGGKVPAELEDLNEKVYAELFLTPRSDAWLGLKPEDVYSGLTNNGVVSHK